MGPVFNVTLKEVLCNDYLINFKTGAWESVTSKQKKIERKRVGKREQKCNVNALLKHTV